jgi:hypothetical protein
MKKHIPLLILSIIAAISILGFVKIMDTTTTGQYQYAGGSIQYETMDVCTQIQCRDGPAKLIRIDSSQYAKNFMIAKCACPETPHILYSAKFIKPVQSYGY